MSDEESYQEVEERQVGGCSALHSAVLLLKGLQGFYCLMKYIQILDEHLTLAVLQFVILILYDYL